MVGFPIAWPATRDDARIALLSITVTVPTQSVWFAQEVIKYS